MPLFHKKESNDKSSQNENRPMRSNITNVPTSYLEAKFKIKSNLKLFIF